ncbi:hypothetical protein Q5P01_023859 [Channa striata]|uniref:Uncharacterized protein n=1 Tax=Channa striata TaxID=64152 RepID=A0AA88IUK6_CHASR|nr:hypothetical protein Q5P01_023859 [Channa striata]
MKQADALTCRKRGLHPSGNRSGLVTQCGDDGLTAHLRERLGPSDPHSSGCNSAKAHQEFCDANCSPLTLTSSQDKP